MNKSIDDEPPEAWSRINKWHRNGPDQHPLFPTKDDPEMLSDLLKEDYKLAEEKMKDSYTRQGYKFKTSWGDEDVNSPTHYAAQGDIECIDAIRAALGSGFKEYLQGNILKYIWRHKYKNGVEDLKKASWYLDRLIEAEITDGD